MDAGLASKLTQQQGRSGDRPRCNQFDRLQREAIEEPLGRLLQFLLSVGAPGKRYALPNARIMMHQPSAGIGGTTADIEIQAENLEFTKRTIERITAEHTGQSPETISRDGDRDRWFTAEEAREYGMVDRVVESLTDVRPAATRRRMGLQ